MTPRPASFPLRAAIDFLEPRFLLAWAPIKNPGFEQPPLSGGPPIPNWVYNEDPGVDGGATRETFSAAFQGTKVAEVRIEGAMSETSRAWIAQMLTTRIAANTTYTLQVLAYSDEGGKYSVEMVAGGVVLASSFGEIDAGDPYPHTVTVSYVAPANPPQVNQNIVVRLAASPHSEHNTHGVVSFDATTLDFIPNGTSDSDPLSVDLVAGGLDEIGEISPGLVLKHNIDFDEENRDASGTVVPDNQPNASTSNLFGGNRTVEDEETVYGSLHMTSPTLRGEWRIDYSAPEKVMVWQWWPANTNVNRPWAHWGMMTEGWSRPDGMPAYYWFRIEALDVSNVTITATVRSADNPSIEKSDTVNVIVNASQTLPGAPTDLQASTVSPTQIDLSWQAPANAPPGTMYNIWRDTTPGFRLYSEYPRFPERKNLIVKDYAAGTIFSDTELPGPGPYYYRVTAVTSGADSVPSNEASAATTIGPFADLDLFEDRNSDGSHDNSPGAEIFESLSRTALPLNTANPFGKLTLTFSEVQGTETVQFTFDPSKLVLALDDAGSNIVPANTPIPISTFNLSGSGQATIFGAVTAPGRSGGSLLLTLGSTGQSFPVLTGGIGTNPSTDGEFLTGQWITLDSLDDEPADVFDPYKPIVATYARGASAPAGSLIGRFVVFTSESYEPIPEQDYFIEGATRIGNNRYEFEISAGVATATLSFVPVQALLWDGSRSLFTELIQVIDGNTGQTLDVAIDKLNNSTNIADIYIDYAGNTMDTSGRVQLDVSDGATLIAALSVGVPISEIGITGHGSFNSMLLDNGDSLLVVGNQIVIVTAQQQQINITPKLNQAMTEGSIIKLQGCNTGTSGNNPQFPGDGSLAQQMSKRLLGITVRGYGMSIKRLGKNNVIGFWRDFRNGAPE